MLVTQFTHCFTQRLYQPAIRHLHLTNGSITTAQVYRKSKRFPVLRCRYTGMCWIAPDAQAKTIRIMGLTTDAHCKERYDRKTLRKAMIWLFSSPNFLCCSGVPV